MKNIEAKVYFPEYQQKKKTEFYKRPLEILEVINGRNRWGFDFFAVLFKTLDTNEIYWTIFKDHDTENFKKGDKVRLIVGLSEKSRPTFIVERIHLVDKKWKPVKQ
jgi:hypothetical protein